MRAVHRVLTPDELVDAVEGLCRRHGLRKPCLVGHSFGTFVVARACQRARVAAAILVDPVATCLMLPTVVAKVLYQLEDRWREMWGLRAAGAAGVGDAAMRAAGVDPEEEARRRPRGLFASSWRERAGLVSRFAFTLARDWCITRELSCAVALRRQFWWFGVCAWPEDMPARALAVIHSRDAILDPDAIATHLLARDAADVLWVEGFAHGEVLAPQGYEARRRVVDFLGALDGNRETSRDVGLGKQRKAKTS